MNAKKCTQAKQLTLINTSRSSAPTQYVTLLENLNKQSPNLVQVDLIILI